MEQDRTTSATTQALAQGRPSAGGQSRVSGRHSLGLAQRGEMEGFAEGFSIFGHLLAASARLGKGRSVAQDLARVPGRAGRKRPARLERDLQRRQLCSGKKRGACVGKTKRGKGTKWMVVVDGQGVPLGKHLASASPNEVTLIEPTLASIAVPRKGRIGRPRSKPQRLIYDKAADSDPLRKRLKKRGIDLICPHRSNRIKPKLQDGRKLRRYRRRWKMERTFAWLGNFRRLVVRYERDIRMYSAFFHVACLMITLRQF
jgi:transposase